MRLVFCFILLFVQFHVFSQQWLGISSSNYSGTHGIYANPANVADTRYKVYLNLAGANVDFANNYVKWGAPYSLFGFVTNTVPGKHRAPNGLIRYSNTYLEEAQGKKNVTAFLGADVRGPSLMFTFDKAKMAVGLTTRGRLITNLNNTNITAAKIIMFGTKQPSIFNLSLTDNHFNANINSYVEMGLTVGKVIIEDADHFMKLGLTMKRVNALLNVHYLVNQVDFKINPQANPNKQDLFLEKAVATYGLTKTGASAAAGLNPNWLFGNTPAGFGYGLDIGFVYEYRPDFKEYDVRLKDRMTTDPTQNKYKYKFGLALLDLGQMRFNNNELVFQTSISKTNVNIPQGTFNKIDSQDKLYSQMNNAFGLSDADYRHAFNVPLPAVVSATFDYSFSDKLYASATLIQNIRSNNSLSMIQPSLFAITPRWETKWLEVSAPVSLYNGYKTPAIGLAGRAGALFLGTDNMVALLNIGNPKSVNFYFGLYAPLFRKLPEGPTNCYYEPRFTLFQDIKDFFNKSKKRRKWRSIR
ncbi:DUF5723 family protein [Emticicia sp. 21SJ11W-3]|uniref:DUF5723 family protein n=1 Tax=Emticicia sp. 21SJ11W-3 TaxID=2916755 RepID=UPI00209DBE18|nr:DUF5723 family protein [Emticicia sp. 21SJ11W-3]UTA69881.1 DUF5723 family protein [Emticicia sp. 21SJ11W-3]